MADEKELNTTTDHPMPTDEQPAMALSPQFRTIYTNFVRAGYTPFDVSLLIGENVGPNNEGKLVVQYQARVTMAPTEAKVVHKILGDLIQAFENQFGPIALPKGLELATGQRAEGV